VFDGGVAVSKVRRKVSSDGMPFLRTRKRRELTVPGRRSAWTTAVCELKPAPFLDSSMSVASP